MMGLPDIISSAIRSAADVSVRRPANWLWQCCVRRPYVSGGGPPLWLRPPAGGRFGLYSLLNGSSATSRAADLFFPLLTMTIYGEPA